MYKARGKVPGRGDPRAPAEPPRGDPQAPSTRTGILALIPQAEVL